MKRVLLSLACGLILTIVLTTFGLSQVSELEVYDSKLEELDLEAALNFATTALSNAAAFWIQCSTDQKQRFQGALFPNGLIFDGKRYRPLNLISFQLLAGYFERRFKSGVPKHSELEPDYCLAESNGHSAFKCGLISEVFQTCGQYMHPTIEWNQIRLRTFRGS